MTFAACVGSPPTTPKLAPPHRIGASSGPKHAKSRRTKPPPLLCSPSCRTHAAKWAAPPLRPSPARVSPRQNPHSARGTATPHITRFRALALFGRRPQQCGDSPSFRRPKTCAGHFAAGLPLKAAGLLRGRGRQGRAKALNRVRDRLVAKVFDHLRGRRPG
jgi:hypothetical protein